MTKSTWVVAVLGAGLGVSCTTPTYDLFEQSQAELAQEVGAQCELAPLEAGEVVLEEQPENCGDFGLCLGIGPDVEGLEQLVMCSCRCDGPDGDGPFCACPDAYTCESVVEALDATSSRYAGAYCVPR